MEVQIKHFNKDIEQNRDLGLLPIADEDFVTIQLEQESTIKDLRDKLTEELKINNESIILHWVGVAGVAVDNDDSLIFNIGEIREGKLYPPSDMMFHRDWPLSFRIDYPALREHLELQLLKANRRFALQKMNEESFTDQEYFTDQDVFSKIAEHLKGGKKKRKTKRKSKKKKTKKRKPTRKTKKRKSKKRRTKKRKSN